MNNPGQHPPNALRSNLLEMYQRMANHFGPLNWWPGDGPTEITIGAILTQNTAWVNVEKAIANLKQAGLLDFRSIGSADRERLAQLIRPSGYFNQKARKLVEFADYFQNRYDCRWDRMLDTPTETLRRELLGLWGVGPETADSILLYALERAVFVVDAYTIRILTRHHLPQTSAAYGPIQSLFCSNLEPNVELYNDFHAQIVYTGKHFCRPTPCCDGCPLQGWQLNQTTK